MFALTRTLINSFEATLFITALYLWKLKEIKN